MSRSALTTKFTLHTMCTFEKSFKEKYKSDNGEPFKGNVIQEITLNVITKKGSPDVSDVITLIKLGNLNCNDDVAYERLNGWLENEDNKALGLDGAFIALCKDLCRDIPCSSFFKKQVDGLEGTIDKFNNAKLHFMELFSQLASHSSNIESVASE